MTRYLRFALPVVICAMSVIGLIANWFNNNEPAANGYFIALLGWLVIATDEFIRFLDIRKDKV